MSIFKKDKGFFGNLGAKIHDTIFAKMEVDEDVMDNLEEILITSDIGMETTMKIMDRIRDKIATDYIVKPENVRKALSNIIMESVDKGDRHLLSDKTPLVILMIGINGGGKTTTIGKLAYRLKKQGKSVMLAAADTFRAAASEQLVIWGERNEIPVIKHQEGADPSAVIFDAIQSAKARHTDVLICDTAGRLQNKKNLMNELEKMNKVISREWPEADRETLDAGRHPFLLRHKRTGTDETLGRLPGEVCTQGGGGDEPSQHPLTAVVGRSGLSAGDPTQMVPVVVAQQPAVVARRRAGDGDGTVLPSVGGQRRFAA